MKDYINLVKRTESVIFDTTEANARLLHGAIGLVTESGELIDALKKSAFYGRKLDKQNLREELGDVMWYLAILLDELDYSFEQCQQDNINKLRKRYPEGFTDVIDRDQEHELSHITLTGSAKQEELKKMREDMLDEN
jgi:NTP pyrophosphatase (non-canonical NTP hydrolase)